jgi:ATP-binding cassette subfamily B protein
MNGITLIKVYGQENHEQQEFSQRNQRLLQANLDLAVTRNWLFPTLTALVGASLLVLLAVGGPAIVAGQITLGDFSALTLYVERLVFPTALLGFTITTYQRGQVSLDRIEAILSVQPTIQDDPAAIEIATIAGSLTAKDLTFRFPDGDRPALDRITFQISPGQMVAIVGPIGAGKTTLANAIPRLLEISPNQLWIDDIDITRLQLACLRRSIGYVPQESFLFNATVMDNIRYGQPDASADQVEQVAKVARIHEEILRFPQQYETLVGERGITLSGGQRQRVALARALLVQVPILILDDSLSSVDNQTALDILANLSQSLRHQTVLFISHRLTTAVDADQILVMDQGRIMQAGSHHQLLQEDKGLYAQLWYQQKLEQALVS